MDTKNLQIPQLQPLKGQQKEQQTEQPWQQRQQGQEGVDLHGQQERQAQGY